MGLGFRRALVFWCTSKRTSWNCYFSLTILLSVVICIHIVVVDVCSLYQEQARHQQHYHHLCDDLHHHVRSRHPRYLRQHADPSPLLPHHSVQVLTILTDTRIVTHTSDMVMFDIDASWSSSLFSSSCLRAESWNSLSNHWHTHPGHQQRPHQRHRHRCTRLLVPTELPQAAEKLLR